MQAVILAAGCSSRFKPISDNKHKGLTEVLGKTIIEHTVTELENLGIENIIIVQSPNQNFEKKTDIDAEFIIQDEPKGMGHALIQAQPLLNEKFLVLNPYHATASSIINDLIKKTEDEESEIGFVSRETDRPEDYGILTVKDGKAVGVTEKPAPKDAASKYRVVGIYLLSPKFFNYLDVVEEWEYQFEDALNRQASEKPASIVFIDEDTISIKYPWNLFDFVKAIFKDKDRKISENASVADSAEIKGKVIIDEDAEIHENAVIKGPVYIGKNAIVGDHALIREYTLLEENTTAGANTEIKNSVMQPNSSIHSGFIGDSIIGNNTHIGAETVVANRKFREDGERPEIKSCLIGKNRVENSKKTFLGAFIGDNVDIGVNVSIMPGVQIGSDAKIGPGTLVRENVENEEIVYVKQEQERKK